MADHGYSASKEQLGLLDDPARNCVVGGEASGRDGRAEELMAAVERLVRRS